MRIGMRSYNPFISGHCYPQPLVIMRQIVAYQLNTLIRRIKENDLFAWNKEILRRFSSGICQLKSTGTWYIKQRAVAAPASKGPCIRGKTLLGSIDIDIDLRL